MGAEVRDDQLNSPRFPFPFSIISIESVDLYIFSFQVIEYAARWSGESTTDPPAITLEIFASHLGSAVT